MYANQGGEFEWNSQHWAQGATDVIGLLVPELRAHRGSHSLSHSILLQRVS